MVTGRRILLLADDSPATQKIVSTTFADEGLEVIVVGDGAEAARRLDAGLMPDVVLADVLMPGLTGYELCERIKGDRRLAHVPVVLLVGTFEPYNEAEARRVGAETVVTKPFQSIRGLVSKVGALLGGSKSEEEAKRPAPTPQEAAAAPPPEEPEHKSPQEAVPPPRDESTSFADLRLDDEMIEARTADAYAQEQTPPDPLETQEMETVRVAEKDAGHDAFAETLRDPLRDFAARHAEEQRDAQVYAQTSAPFVPAHVAEEAHASRTAFAARVGGGSAATDDALLDLDLDAPATSVTDDDFILDLDDEPAAPPALASAPAPDAAGAFAEAAHGETVFDESAAAWPAHDGEAATPVGGEVAAEVVAQDEPLGFVGESESSEQRLGDAEDFGSPTAREMLSATVADEMVAPAHEVSGETSHEVFGATRSFVEPEVVPAAQAPHPAGVADFTDGSVEGDVARPPAGYEMGAARVGVEESLRPEQLSPEVIETIARRVVELMSDKVVREIAWEVVPDLAELLIKQKLEEDARKQ